MADDREYEDYPMLGFGRVQRRGADGIFRFELDEVNAEAHGYKSMGSATSFTVYTVPAGKKFHLRSLVIHGGVKAENITFYNSTVTAANRVLKFRVKSGTTALGNIQLHNMQGFCFTGAVKVVLASIGTGMNISVGGILDPQADV
jgi:hypothetical protein